MLKSKKFYLYYLLFTVLFQICWILYIIFRGGFDRFINIFVNHNSLLILKVFSPIVFSIPILLTVIFFLNVMRFIPGSSYFSWYFDEMFDKKKKLHDDTIRQSKNNTEHKL